MTDLKLADLLRDLDSLVTARKEALTLVQDDPELAEHPDLAYPLHGLGNVCRDQQRYSEAEAHYERALTLREASLPADDPDLIGLREDYVVLLRATGREEEARDLEAGVN